MLLPLPNIVKRLLEARKHFYPIKTSESITSKKFGSIPPLCNGPEALSSAFDKAKLIGEIFFFFESSNLVESGRPLIFCSLTNLNLEVISKFPSMIKKDINTLDSLKSFGLAYFLIVIPKNC